MLKVQIKENIGTLLDEFDKVKELLKDTKIEVSAIINRRSKFRKE